MCAFVAQLVEQLALNETVGGSNPPGGTKRKIRRKADFSFSAPEQGDCSSCVKDSKPFSNICEKFLFRTNRKRVLRQ